MDTDREARRVATIVEEHCGREGRPPSVREVAWTLNVSRSTAHTILRAAVTRGLLVGPVNGQARGFRPPKESSE